MRYDLSEGHTAPVAPWWAELGREFTRLREARGLTIDQLVERAAARTDLPGTFTRGTLVNIENNSPRRHKQTGKIQPNNPTARILTAVAMALDARIEAHLIDPVGIEQTNDPRARSLPRSATSRDLEGSPSMIEDPLVGSAANIARLVVERGTEEQRKRLGLVLAQLLAELSGGTPNGGAVTQNMAKAFRDGPERRHGTARDTGLRRRSTDAKEA